MAVYIGLSLGPALGGLLTGIAGWRSIFWINIPIGIAVMVLAWRFVRDTGEIRKEERLDMPGVLLFSVGLTSLLIFLTLGEQYGWGSAGIIGLIVLATISLLVFFVVERRKGQAAMLDTSLITGNRLFAAANFSALLNYAAYFSVAFMLSYYMQEVLGYSILYTGLVLLIMPVVMAVLSPISGWASDRIGSRSLASIGMATVAMGLLYMSALTTTSSVLYIGVGLLVLGVGMGLFSSPNTSAVMGCVERRRLGVASGTLSTMRFVGQAVSLSIMGAIIASVAGPDFISSLTAGSGQFRGDVRCVRPGHGRRVPGRSADRRCRNGHLPGPRKTGQMRDRFRTGPERPGPLSPAPWGACAGRPAPRRGPGPRLSRPS